MAEGPLTGVEVLDLSLNLPGPYATAILLSLGASVIKVEPPKGDPARHIGELFARVNRGKKSVVLDLRDPSGQDALRALAVRTDVVVEGFRPGVMSRLGLSPEAALAANPRLVWCSISAFGATGPRSADPAHDLNCQALSGLAWLERDRRDRPMPTMLPIADLSVALCAVAGINAALLARTRTGRGAILDAAMIDPAAHFTATWANGVDPGARAPRGLRRLLSRERLYALPHYGLFRCQDGLYLAIGIVDEDAFWKKLCDALGFPWLSSLRLPARMGAGVLLRPLVAARIRMRDRATWLARLQALDLPVSPVLDADEAAADPHLALRGSARRPPIPGAVPTDGPIPALGEHTAEVLGRLGSERGAQRG